MGQVEQKNERTDHYQVIPLHFSSFSAIVWSFGLLMMLSTGQKIAAQATIESSKNLKDTTVWIDESTSLRFVLIEEGTFLMGSQEQELNRDRDESPLHSVRIGSCFYMGQFEVTQKQFEAVMGHNPAIFDDYITSPDHPVENVSWEAANLFLEKLNSLDIGQFRLPTEAEWEYACRAGTQTPYYWGHEMKANGSSEYSWANSRSSGRTHPVGQKKPNAWGLYDMSGNVWEWCSDWYGAYSASPQIDPRGPETGTNKVFRGGSWFDLYGAHRCANRHRHATHEGYTAIGFRLVMIAK